MPWLKSGIYVFLGSESLLASSVFMCNPNRGYAAILILSIIFDYWHNVLEAVVSDLWTFWVTGSDEGYLSAYTVFFYQIVPLIIVYES